MWPEPDVQSLKLKLLLDQAERSVETLGGEPMFVYQPEPVVFRKKRRLPAVRSGNWIATTYNKNQ